MALPLALINLVPIAFQNKATAYALIVALLIGGGFYSGHRWAMASIEKEKRQAIERYILQKEAVEKEDNKIALELADDLMAKEEKHRERIYELEEYIRNNDTYECLDATGLQLFNKGRRPNTSR